MGAESGRTSPFAAPELPVNAPVHKGCTNSRPQRAPIKTRRRRAPRGKIERSSKARAGGAFLLGLLRRCRFPAPGGGRPAGARQGRLNEGDRVGGRKGIGQRLVEGRFLLLVGTMFHGLSPRRLNSARRARVPGGSRRGRN